MNKYNEVDCCFDCINQFNQHLCTEYCLTKDNCHKKYCSPGACSNFERKQFATGGIVSTEKLQELFNKIENEQIIKLPEFNLNFKVITNKEYEELQEYKRMYLDLCK